VISGLGRLEHDIDELIWTLAGVEPEAGACLTAQFSSVRARGDALVSLCHLAKLPEKSMRQVNKFCSAILGVADQRNRLAHDPWSTDARTGKVYRFQRTAKGRLDQGYKLVTELDLKDITDSIGKLADRFHVIKTEVLDAFYKALPKGSGQPFL
jgi:hypothetical protein